MEWTLIAFVVLILLAAVIIAEILTHGGSPAQSQNRSTTANSTSTSSTTTRATTSSTTTSIPAQTNVTPMTNTSYLYTVQFGYSNNLGQYLTNQSGFTLYLSTSDTPYNGTSFCYAQCAKTWIPFYVSFLNVPSQLDSEKFGVIDRTDGRKQLTYNGYPLYLYVYDKSAGQVNGNGVAGIWNVVTYPNALT